MIADNEITAIAKLAKIDLEVENLPLLVGDINRIIEFVSQMDAVATDGIDPLAHPLELELALRVDKVTESDQRDAFQHDAPAVQNGLYLVPKVID